ncbi:MAG: bifunctional (p)ppGpp synthetase/guanosine-3',5'-bis(diphosphate) 3'-pyrophosphohydrolase [Chloroflexi bacterium]|nr:bifunctional (p)ppGpp synthetase/guanosine-3',5'-bis(diphosphate) 3'-pyrophosphohydrolase [Chloroflexota bacterium]
MNEWHECYLALGHLHQIWRPVPGTFDDYIAVPRDNLYRSLHTTVVHANGQAIKLRIRTVAMDKVSESFLRILTTTSTWSRLIRGPA